MTINEPVELDVLTEGLQAPSWLELEQRATAVNRRRTRARVIAAALAVPLSIGAATIAFQSTRGSRTDVVSQSGASQAAAPTTLASTTSSIPGDLPEHPPVSMTPPTANTARSVEWGKRAHALLRGFDVVATYERNEGNDWSVIVDLTNPTDGTVAHFFLNSFPTPDPLQQTPGAISTLGKTSKISVLTPRRHEVRVLMSAPIDRYLILPGSQAATPSNVAAALLTAVSGIDAG